MRKIYTILFLLSILISNTIIAQTIYYVDASRADNSGNGLSWATAKKDIQDAINIAPAGTQVWVKAGTYYPDEGTGLINNDRNGTFNLKDSVKVYGSFVGTEITLTQRIINLNNITTILSGEIQQDTDTTNNAYHVVTATDITDAQTRLDGFKIKLGNANGGTVPTNNGGGLLINALTQSSNNLTTINCIFENNNAAGQGGGICAEATTGKTFTNVFENSRFISNSASFDGGAMVVAAVGGSNLSPIRGCHFFGNRANSSGAIHITASLNGTASPLIVNSTFENNSAFTDASAVSNRVPNGTSNTQIMSSIFNNNHCGGRGGAIFSFASQGSNNLKIVECDFILNKVGQLFDAGAISILTDNALANNNTTVNKCKFSFNEALIGGAVAFTNFAGNINSNIYQSLFYRNKGDYGSAIDSYIANGTTNANIVNCTITQNISDSSTALGTFVDGPGISMLKAVNSIIWNNTNRTPNKDVDLYANTDSLINCLVGNPSCAAIGNGGCSNTLYGINPLFVNPTSANYSLQAYSPAIHNGSVHSSTATMDSTDLAGNQRYFGIVDIGAYEFFCTTIYDTVIQNACLNYTWASTGQTYTLSGMYSDTLLTILGCDSIITLNLTINNSTSSTQTVTTCDNYAWIQNGITYSISGVYNDTIPNAAGCDSIITLNLTINNSTSSTQTVTTCDSYTWGQNGITYSISGVYNDTIPSAAGCDSIISLNLIINNSPNLSITQNSNILTANETGATYQWINCASNSAINGETNQSFTATVNGNYAVVVTKNNCSDTSVCVNVNTVGINEFSASSIGFTVIPNPSTGYLTIDLRSTNIESGILKIINNLGEEVNDPLLVNGHSSFVINLANAPRGVYFIQVVTNDSKMYTRKIVLE